jgi:hypothetical protein
VHDALGASKLVQGLPNWLAGNNTLSAAAIFGALTGGALLAGIPAWINREPRPPRDEAKAEKAGKDDKVKEKARAKAAQASSAGKAKTAAKKNAPAPRGNRIPELGWAALFLLLLGAALFAFAFGVDPLWPPQDATAAALKHYHDMSGRAHPVYVAAWALLAGGGVLGLVWLLWRRKP